MNSYHTTDDVRGLDALAVSRRCALLCDTENFPLIWMLQERSMEPGGLSMLAAELVTMFRDRLNLDQLRAFRWEPLPALANFLQACCFNSGERFDTWDGLYWRGSLVDDLHALRAHMIVRAEKAFCHTAASRQVFTALEHALASPGSMTLAFGPAGVGKSEAAKAFCQINPGVARYVEVPSVENDRAFYSAIAEQLGVVRGPGYNSQQTSLRVIDVLKKSRLLLVLDESQHLWPQKNRLASSPPRILWLTSLVNAGVPVALVSMPDFFTFRQLFIKWANWNSARFDRRLSMIQELPTQLCQADLRGVAAHLMPAGSAKCLDLLVSYAEASKINLSAIVETLRTARIQAKHEGRTEATFSDLQTAIRSVRIPMDNYLAADATRFAPAQDLPQPAHRRRRASAIPSRDIGEPSAPDDAEGFEVGAAEVLPPQVHRHAVAPSPAAR